MSAVKRKDLVDLTVKTLQDTRDDRDYKLFYEAAKKSASIIKDIINADGTEKM